MTKQTLETGRSQLDEWLSVDDSMWQVESLMDPITWLYLILWAQKSKLRRFVWSRCMRTP